MHFHADRGGFPGTYCRSDWFGVRPGENISSSSLARTSSIKQVRQDLLDIIVVSCGIIRALGGSNPERGHTCLVDFDDLKSCLLHAPILGFPAEDGRFILDTDTSLLAVGVVLNQLQDDREVVIAYASRSLRMSQ